jgi:hypothetical protein
MGMATMLIIESALGIAAFRAQVEWYAVLTPGTVAGLGQLETLAPRNATIVVSPGAGRAGDQGWPYGWWVEGLLDRPTYYASSSNWLNFADERRRAAIANAIFNSPDGMSGGIRLAREDRISYIVVNTAWSGYRDWVSRGSALDGATVVLDTESILVIATHG